jgi:hypothetical protein
VRILKDFKSNDFVSADFRGVTREILVSADSKRVREEQRVELRADNTAKNITS